LGPKATAFFFNLVIDNTIADNDQEHIDAVYLNHCSMPDRTEAILSNNTDQLKDLLIKDAVTLENLGCSHIAIPCNTSHYFWDDIQASVNIPVINMIEETISYIRQRYGPAVARIGVLATNGTKEMKIYDKYANKSGIEIMYPSESSQQKVMEVIYNEVKAGKKAIPSELAEINSEFIANDCDVTVLGCTELSVIFNGYTNPYMVDPLLLLARKSIELAGKKVKI